MALELKGLKAKAMTARAHIGRLDEAYDAFNAKAGNHVIDVEGLTEQLGDMAEDLSFATAVLGNSVASSNAGAAEKPLPGGPRVLPDGPAGAGDLNLPGPVGTRVALGPHPDQPEGQQPSSQQAGSASASADPQSSGAAVLALKDAAE